MEASLLARWGYRVEEKCPCQTVPWVVVLQINSVLESMQYSSWPTNMELVIETAEPSF